MAELERELGPDDPEVARGVNLLALLLDEQGDYAAARPLYARGLSIRETALGPWHTDVAVSLNNLGALLQAQGDYSGARPLLERSLAIREAALGQDHPDVAESLNNLALLEVAVGDYAAARPRYERSLAIREAAWGADHPGVAVALNNLAGLLRTQGDLAGAQPLYERSLTIWEQQLGPNHPNVAMTLNNLARLHRSLGDDAGARALYERSLHIFEATGGPEHPNVAIASSNLAAVTRALGDLAGARALYQRSLAIGESVLGPDHPEVGRTLNNLAGLMVSEGDLAGAAPLYRRSLAIEEAALGSDHPFVAASLNNLANLLEAQGEANAARALRSRALGIAESRLDLIGALSHRESMAYLTSSRSTLDGWLSAFDRPGDEAQAWATALRWKGVVSRQMQDRREAMPGDPGTAPLQRDLSDVLRARAALTFAESRPEIRDDRTQRLAALQGQQEHLERALASASETWRATHRRLAAGPQDVCGALPPGTGLVDFLGYNRASVPSYAAFVVVSPGCVVERVELGPSGPIDDAVEAWRVSLQGAEQVSSRIEDRGGQVARLIWDPVAEVLDGAERIWVSPDGALAAVPFAALPTGPDRYLVEDHPLRVVSDARDLLRVPSQRAGTGLLAVGGVAFGPEASDAEAAPERCWDGPFAALPGTATEVTSLARRWRRGAWRSEPVKVLTGAAASEGAVSNAMTGRRVVHLATHGFFASGACDEARSEPDRLGDDPALRSGLVLAGANGPTETIAEATGTDGVLSALEVGLLDLRGTRLVVLSACGSGLGVTSVGEGVQGLQRAFADAGAEALVMTLWAVSDAATSSLMERFYDRWLSPGDAVDPADALRAAQIATLEDRRARFGEARPQDWAPFVVSTPTRP